MPFICLICQRFYMDVGTCPYCIKENEMTEEERFEKAMETFNNGVSYGEGMACPLCGTRGTKPFPGCGCGGNPHRMRYHHRCNHPAAQPLHKGEYR